MSLRLAKFSDHWRHVLARNYPTRFTQLSFVDLPCIRDSTVEFVAGITAIIGSNGAGKSTLVAAISELLSNGSEVAAGHRSRIAGSKTDGTVYEEEVMKLLQIREDASGKREPAGALFEGEFRWLDPSGLANSCVTQIHTDQNFDDLLEPITPLRAVGEDLDLVSYVVGRKYTSLEIYEISDYGGLALFPYFRVASAGVAYGSEAMGRGELALLLTYWTFRDLPANSIVVIEEPETHVSPRSQDCLMNMLAKFSDEMRIWTIIATHSPTIIRHLPAEQIKMVTRDTAPSALMNRPTRTQIAAILGGGVALQGVLLVEDWAAKGFLSVIGENGDPDLLRQFEIVQAGSESNITKALLSMPRPQQWLTLIGVYDGDMKASLERAPGMPWPRVFLPSEMGPEQLFKWVVENHPDIVAALVTELHKPSEAIVLAIDSAAGADPHDYLVGISTALTLEKEAVLRAIARVWLSHGANNELANEFLGQVRNAINAIVRP
jgi:predicted ATPase